MGINRLGTTVTPMTSAVDVKPTSHGDVHLTMTNEQLVKLTEVLDTCVDDDVLRLDWNEPETADFVRALTDAVREAML